MKNELWCLLWSKNQNALHVEPLSTTLETNRQACQGNASLTDYHVVDIGQRERVDATAAMVGAHLSERGRLTQ